MHDPDDIFKVGTRIRLSTLGKERSRRTKTQTGVVIGRPFQSDALRVQMDGAKQPITLHISYVERE
jgi:hypothetical protein